MAKTKEINHKERAHALLSASAANRWLACTPSARLEDEKPDSTSVYAEEGTLAHEIAELKLTKYFHPMAKSTFTRRLNKFKKRELYQDEMLKHTETYLDYIKELTINLEQQPYAAIEKQVDFSHIAPEGFGTADCIIVADQTLYVNDFKYGKGIPVSAEDNPQMKLYALGAYTAYSLLFDIQKVHMSIVQPRLDIISEFEMSVPDLLAWGEEIKPIAEKAFKGEGEFVPGEHCKFCKLKATCRARADQFTALEDFGGKKPPELSDDEVGQVLEKAQTIASWVKALQDYALKQSLKGKEIPGWKAVAGRGSRNYVNVDEAFKQLKEAGIDDALLYERTPLTVPKIEKELGAKQYRELLEEPGHVQKSPGKPTLAPAKDKRMAVTNEVSAEEDFKAGGEGA